MSEAQLSAVREQLLAIPSTEVDSPQIPMANVLQEANDLHTLVRDSKVWSALEAVGVTTAIRDELEQMIGATRAAQSQWTVTRDRSKDEAQREREERGATLRSDLLAACRFNLRDDRTALATLGAISQGDGVADLVQDLSDLATLIEQRRAAFERDKTFDPSKRAEAARSLSSEIAAGISGERTTNDQTAALELRDRAYTRLDDLVSTLREAGRYAFREDAKLRGRFSSAFLRRRRKRSGADTAVAPEAPGE